MCQVQWQGSERPEQVNGGRGGEQHTRALGLQTAVSSFYPQGHCKPLEGLGDQLDRTSWAALGREGGREVTQDGGGQPAMLRGRKASGLEAWGGDGAHGLCWWRLWPNIWTKGTLKAC